MGIWSLWLFIAVGFLIAELLTMSTTCLYIGLGALTAMCAAFLSDDWLVTTITFVGSTALYFLLTYRLRGHIISLLHREGHDEPTGMDALIGRTGVVYKASDTFRMKIDGDVWQVKAEEGDPKLIPGEEVRVTGYDSIILRVEKY